MMNHRSPPGPLYAIADAEVLGEERLPAAVSSMAEHGIRWIQVRAKKLAGGPLCRLLDATFEALRDREVDLWLDDRVDVAALFPLAGVHVGQRDLPASAVRRLLGAATAIGVSTHDRRQVASAAADEAVDVLAVGPVFPTTGKQDPEAVVGLELLRWAREHTAKTLVAIGGIDAHSLPRVLAAGADGAALLGAVCRGDIERNCRQLATAAEEWG